VSQQTTRRDFIKTSAALSATAMTGAAATRLRAETTPNEKLNLAFIGVGNRGGQNFEHLRHQNVVALCDVDGHMAKKVFEQYPDVPKFNDYRQMHDKMHNSIDGVVISTPDHTHFHPAYQSLQLGKHIYLEKPLAHSLWETRTLCDLAREKGLATQLGAQRHTLKNMHHSVELIQQGAIGTVTEVYCWVGGDRGMPAMPDKKPPVPSTLDWELWCGPAKMTDYSPKIAPYGWRFWWDYGTGETGNWGCHILDIPYWALGLKYPHRVSGSGPEVDPLRTPKQMQSTMEFAKSDTHGPLKLHWDHAANGPDILRTHDLPSGNYNTLFIGTAGMLLTGFEQYQLIGREAKAEKLTNQGTHNFGTFYEEWINACKGGPAASCNFDYSGPMAETVLLGNVAYRSKSSFDWDPETLTASTPEAQALVKPKFRQGWEIG